jgi:hypothetical protein
MASLDPKADFDSSPKTARQARPSTTVSSAGARSPASSMMAASAASARPRGPDAYVSDPLALEGPVEPCGEDSVCVLGAMRSPVRTRALWGLTENLTKEQALEGLIARGPPAGSGISAEAWRSWHRSGFIICPASKGRYTCSDHQCRMGVDCRELRALGLKGDRSPLPRKERPVCGARNRRGKPCGVRVEPGRARCRFHGGLSTGPKTAAGRARIAAAQRRRWSAFRRARNSSP